MTVAPASAVTFRTRGYRETDESFLYSSFLKSQRDEDVFAGIGNTSYYQHLTAAFASMLATFETIVAHPESDEEEICGYILFKGPVLGALYVKKEPWRGQGVARLLFETALLHTVPTIRVMFPTSKGMKLAKVKGIYCARASHVEALALTARAA